jgi:hypothetical protein
MAMAQQMIYQLGDDQIDQVSGGGSNEYPTGSINTGGSGSTARLRDAATKQFQDLITIAKT